MAAELCFGSFGQMTSGKSAPDKVVIASPAAASALLKKGDD